MPSSPIRLTAMAPSTRCCNPARTSLNIAHLFARDFGQPSFETRDFRVRGIVEDRRSRLSIFFGDRQDCLSFTELLELRAHVIVVRIARENRFVDLPRVVGQSLPRVP